MDEKKVIKISDAITVEELANSLNIPVVQMIGELFKQGIMATINQRLDFETASLIVSELGLAVEVERKTGSNKSAEKTDYVLSNTAKTRPPIVAIMGHVDHGKTTLLDTLLGQKVADGEAGGITQHISAYQIKHDDKYITFLDTPGHEAFAAIRQHGAELTDIVVLVVAADDGVKPQTVEAINFARSANAKIIVAINKIDKPAADANRTMTQLASEYNLMPEEWGGDTIMIPLSAKTGENLDKLLDMILLVASVDDFRADYDVPAQGMIIESRMATGKGVVANVLVEQGYLTAGSYLVAGQAYGKVRTMLDFKGKPKGKAGPATPVEITGFKLLPQFGDKFQVVASEKIAKKIAVQNSENNSAEVDMTGSDLLNMMSQSDEQQSLKVVVKADVLGSLTSVMDSLKMIDGQHKIVVDFVGSGIGDISENDILLASGPDVIIYGFNVNMPASVKRMAVSMGVNVRIYKIIYELLDDARAEMTKMLSPEVKEAEQGELVVRGVFRTTQDMVIAGGEMLKGKLRKDYIAKIIRDKVQVGEAIVGNVQSGKLDVPEVTAPDMCGLSLKTAGKKLKLDIGDHLVFITREFIEQKI
jgi:translation initiation factor IF-2